MALPTMTPAAIFKTWELKRLPVPFLGTRDDEGRDAEVKIDLAARLIDRSVLDTLRAPSPWTMLLPNKRNYDYRGFWMFAVAEAISGSFIKALIKGA